MRRRRLSGARSQFAPRATGSLNLAGLGSGSMQKAKGKKQKARMQRRRGCLRLAFFLFPFSFLLFLGCAYDRRVASNDPLVCGPALPTGGASPSRQPVANRPLPPLPGPSPATSTAALAAAPQPRPLDPTHDLRIGRTPTGMPTSGNGQGAGNGGGTVLQPPQPLPEQVKPSNPTGIDNAVATAGGRLTNYEQAQAQLAARGVKWQRLEQAGPTGDWRFTCSLPGREKANVNRTYEATGPDHLTAIQRVLEKIQAEQ